MNISFDRISTSNIFHHKHVYCCQSPTCYLVEPTICMRLGGKKQNMNTLETLIVVIANNRTHASKTTK